MPLVNRINRGKQPPIEKKFTKKVNPPPVKGRLGKSLTKKVNPPPVKGRLGKSLIKKGKPRK